MLASCANYVGKKLCLPLKTTKSIIKKIQNNKKKHPKGGKKDKIKRERERKKKKDLEMPGIEPGASHMRSERSTTELHPQRNTQLPL